MKPRFVLDSYAVLTYLKEEPGWPKVKNLLWDAQKNRHSVFLNTVNLGEIYYIILRENGPAIADQAVSLIKLWPIKLVNVDEQLALVAGRMKGENKISYADAFVVATALTKKATIITGDKEFKNIEDLLPIDWLPKNK